MMTVPTPSLFSRIGTLVRRERQTRFAGGALGLLWAYLTPLSWIAFVVIVFRLLGRVPPIYVAPEIFVATGVLPYIIFRQTITSLGRTLPANRYLRYIKPVDENELLMASAISELINAFIMSAMVFLLLTTVFGIPGPHQLGGVAFVFGVAWFLASGVGRLFAAIGRASDSFARAVPILLRPMFWLSGIFYTATELPGSVQDILWYSPTFQVTELLREAYFIGYTSPISDLYYPLLFGGICFALAFPIEKAILKNGLSRERL